MAFCTKCGAKLQEGVAFCGACGAQVSDANSTPGGAVAPGVSPSKQRGAPVFTPPQDSAPTFQPPQEPVPTFQPPGGVRNGAVCFHHPLEPAAARCARCGKYICKDCAEAYGVSSGEYAGKCLCFDCCEELVSQNVAELTRNKEKIKAQFITSLVGIGIGFLGSIVTVRKHLHV